MFYSDNRLSIFRKREGEGEGGGGGGGGGEGEGVRPIWCETSVFYQYSMMDVLLIQVLYQLILL